MVQHTKNTPLVLVTGAFGIICPAIVRALREKGWRVAAAGRNEESLALHNKIMENPLEADGFFYADIASQQACENLVKEVESALGPIYGIVNGAVINPGTEFTKITESVLNLAMTINFATSVYLAQAAYDSLIQQKGAILNLSSVLIDEPRKGGLIYRCSKAALEKVTEALATEFLEAEVRVNTIRVGRVPGHAFMRELATSLSEEQSKQMAREIHTARLQKMRRSLGNLSVGTPEDIANAACFLLSPEARFINGQTLVMDGGYSLKAGENQSNIARNNREMLQTWMAQNCKTHNE